MNEIKIGNYDPKREIQHARIRNLNTPENGYLFFKQFTIDSFNRSMQALGVTPRTTTLFDMEIDPFPEYQTKSGNKDIGWGYVDSETKKVYLPSSRPGSGIYKNKYSQLDTNDMLLASYHEMTHRQMLLRNDRKINYGNKEITVKGNIIGLSDSNNHEWFFQGFEEAFAEAGRRYTVQKVNQIYLLNNRLPEGGRPQSKVADYYDICDIVVSRVAKAVDTSKALMWENILRQGLKSRNKYFFDLVAHEYGENGLIVLGLLGNRNISEKSELLIDKFFNSTSKAEQNVFFEQIKAPLSENVRSLALILPQAVQKVWAEKKVPFWVNWFRVDK